MGTYPHSNEDNGFQPAEIFSAFAQPSPALAHHLREASSADEAITDEAIPEKKKERKKNILEGLPRLQLYVPRPTQCVRGA